VNVFSIIVLLVLVSSFGSWISYSYQLALKPFSGVD